MVVKDEYVEGKLAEYSIAFFKRHDSGWYDEIRHDSHEKKKGRYVVAPHFHIKLRCELKDSIESGVGQIHRFIDEYLETLKGVME